MATAPEVYSGSVTMLADEPGVGDINVRKGVVVGGLADERRADCKERVDEGPGVFEARAHTKKGAGTSTSVALHT